MSSNKQQVIHGDVTAVTEVATQAPTERAREVLMAELCGLGATLTSAMEASPDFVPCGHAFGELIAGLYGAVVSDDEAALTELADTARSRSEHVAEHRGVTQAAAVFPKLDDANARDSRGSRPRGSRVSRSRDSRDARSRSGWRERYAGRGLSLKASLLCI